MDAKAINASLAYAKALGAISQGGTASTEPAEGTSFSDLLKNYASEAVSTSQAAERASIQAVSSAKPELVDIAAAVSNAELTIETVTALRDRVIGAYQDIMKMPI